MSGHVAPERSAGPLCAATEDPLAKLTPDSSLGREPMPAKRSAMRKIKEILRLKFEAKLSHERIATVTGASKGA